MAESGRHVDTQADGTEDAIKSRQRFPTIVQAHLEKTMEHSDKYPDSAEVQTYRIRIRSHLSSDWCGMPGVVALIQGYDDQGHPITTLLLEVADRSALMGVLNEMHGVNLPILAMEYVEDLPAGGK